MPEPVRSPRLCAYQAQRQAIQREYEASRQALWDEYLRALMEAQDAYTADVTLPIQETTP